ncbi:hypothetical protein NQZ68_017091 [Dissostichus eleginoides]|nr:hypothetical protein NQZ68_017091 [Dissostichus eleginoides]
MKVNMVRSVEVSELLVKLPACFISQPYISRGRLTGRRCSPQLTAFQLQQGLCESPAKTNRHLTSGHGENVMLKVCSR